MQQRILCHPDNNLFINRDDDAHIITQDQLARFQYLRECNAEYNQLRAQLTLSMQSGAIIERGVISARLERRHARRLTREKVFRICGSAYAEWLYEQIEPSESFVVKLNVAVDQPLAENEHI